MDDRGTSFGQARPGFSLIELLVVLLILALLTAIVVPSVISTQPERNLAAAGDRFANDFNYARAKALATGNPVYFGFITDPDLAQVEGVWEMNYSPPPVLSPTKHGETFLNPGNPGVSRTAKAYYIVEERPRRMADGSVYTYLDWLNDYDAWDPSDNDPPYPVEPLFPFDAEESQVYGPLPDPTAGEFNRFAAPLALYPQNMLLESPSMDYEDRHIVNVGLEGSAEWYSGDPDDQAYKIFCIADEQEILGYDQNLDYDPATNLRTYDPVPGGVNGGHSGSAGDHPRLLDQVVDYVLLKYVELPDHVFLLNPWRDYWVVGWEDIEDPNDPGSTIRAYDWQDMQILQFLVACYPSGETSLAEWTYDPEPYPDGTYGSTSAGDALVHGRVTDRGGLPVVRSVWMVLDECLDFGAYVESYGTGLPGSRVDVVNNRKANVSSSGRIFSFWPLNGKYYVDDYTPNDGTRSIDPDDPRLNLSYNYEDGGSNPETDEMPLVAREYGYTQNFLVPPPPID